MSTQFEISVELTAGEGQPVAFKFSCELFELNVLVPQAQLASLDRVSEQAWASGSIAAGHSAGASVFWSSGKPGHVAIMVGSDDEAWDISASVPIGAFATALAEAKSLVRTARGV